ncbi:MAG: 2,3-bisphosphoglycerate-independent phosphoglycerate mutase [Alphaproteobacteria bacterium]|nr:2,3-bisphosphoglycerate-independent phosphoglycerate mutase [Alphaproteobacteria bacterium]
MSPIVLCILDGVGINSNTEHNAVALANMPYFDNLIKKYPHSKLNASGVSVGLPNGIMGNSEVGHITIGSGRVVNQFLRRFQLENWDKNKALADFINSIKLSGGIVHFAGLMSDGRVHADINDMLFIIKHILNENLKICIHFIADGRDTPQKSAKKYIELIKNELKESFDNNSVWFGTLSGRYWTMDRNNNDDRTQLAFDAIARAQSDICVDSIDKAIDYAYENDETDEFIKPIVISGTKITNKDGFVFGNYRSDRARQIMRKIMTTGTTILSFSQYGEDLDNAFPALLPDIPVVNTLGDVLEQNNISQLRIAETEKYNHVTYFMDAERNIDYKHEEKVLIPSPDVATFDLKPEMSANEITNALLPRLSKYDVVLLNYANGDMVGHTGNEIATIKAMETLDKQLSTIIPQILELNGTAIIIADHGNAEQMWDYEHNVPLTSHTTNPVNCIVVSNKNLKITDGGLADIAPTILKLLNIPKPKEMTGNSLIID